MEGTVRVHFNVLQQSIKTNAVILRSIEEKFYLEIRIHIDITTKLVTYTVHRYVDTEQYVQVHHLTWIGGVSDWTLDTHKGIFDAYLRIPCPKHIQDYNMLSVLEKSVRTLQKTVYDELAKHIRVCVKYKHAFKETECH